MGLDWAGLEEAIALRNAGKKREALDKLRSLELSAFEANELATVLIGEIGCLIDLGDTNAARKLIDQTRRLRTAEKDIAPRIDLLRARIAIAEGRAEEAIRILEHTLESHADVLKTPQCLDLYQEIQVQQGSLLVECDRPEEALPILLEADSFDLWKADTAFNLGVCYFKLQNWKATFQNFQKALALDLGKDMELTARSYLGVLYYEKKSYARALEEFLLAAGSNHDPRMLSEPMRKWMERTYRALNMLEEAKKYK